MPVQPLERQWRFQVTVPQGRLEHAPHGDQEQIDRPPGIGLTGQFREKLVQVVGPDFVQAQVADLIRPAPQVTFFLRDGGVPVARDGELGLVDVPDEIAQGGRQTHWTQPVIGPLHAQAIIIGLGVGEGSASQRHPAGGLATEIGGDRKIGEEFAVAVPQSPHAALA